MENTWSSSRLDDSAGGLPRGLLNLGVGLGVSVAIFLALARFRLVKIEHPLAAVETLQTVRLPDLPPPAPETQTASAAPVGATLLFPTVLKGASSLEPSPSDSIIRVRATSPSMGPVVQPAIEPLLNFDPGLFRPRGELADADPDHVFNLSEVDQPAHPKSQPSPNISRRLFDSVKDPRVTVLMLVNDKGAVEKVWLLRTSGNEEFDARMTEGVKEWEFHPARKKGKAVRQWVQQAFVVRLPSGSRFAP
jgi:TonB family protein